MDIDYSRLPEAAQGGMRRYIEHGIMPGSFLTAVLENDLSGSFGAADHINVLLIHNYVKWLYNYAPSPCWGSPEAVKEWAASRKKGTNE